MHVFYIYMCVYVCQTERGSVVGGRKGVENATSGERLRLGARGIIRVLPAASGGGGD